MNGAGYGEIKKIKEKTATRQNLSEDRGHFAGNYTLNEFFYLSPSPELGGMNKKIKAYCF
jgi:hypothetical protein